MVLDNPRASGYVVESSAGCRWAGPRKVLALGYHQNPDVVLGGRQLFCPVPLACVQESLKSVSGSWFMKRVARLE